jgi:FHS family glucose/mannose:H+ symporter-like MFS transporter
MERVPGMKSSTATVPRWISITIIYLGFAGTGLGMALPGSVLPALLKQWSLADSQAGFFFFLGWMGTSIGALLVRPSRVRSLVLGSFLIAIGALGMAFASRWVGFAFMAVYGVGLGMTMTAVSLLQAARNILRRGLELNRLNLIWALGACICPWLAEHSLRVANVRVIFSALGVFFALYCVWTVAFEVEPITQALALITAEVPKRGISTLSLWPFALVLVIFLPTGIEASMGAWIAAYVQRTQHAISTTVTAGSCFWIGLMLSRTLSSFVLLLRRSERIVLSLSLVNVVAGTGLLIASTVRLGILPGIFLIGFGLGPVYPLLLAIALQYSEKTAIFFVAGLGSAFLPWLTGIVSSATSSLRLGLLVPMFASLVMLGLGLHVIRLSSQAYFKPPL